MVLRIGRLHRREEIATSIEVLFVNFLIYYSNAYSISGGRLNAIGRGDDFMLNIKCYTHLHRT
jgi:hypothetical protein